jgi:hypothetical protein
VVAQLQQLLQDVEQLQLEANRMHGRAPLIRTAHEEMQPPSSRWQGEL